MVKEKKSNLVFVLKTKLNAKKWDWLKMKLNFDGCFVVDPIGRTGDLALLLKLEVGFTIQSYSKNHITESLKLDVGNKEWQFTSFYGQLDVNKRQGT